MDSYRDRRSAGRRLGLILANAPDVAGVDPLVLGLPRGGVPVAAEVADVLGADLDVLLVRKLGVPRQPELAMGAVGEGGVVVVNADIRRHAGVGDDDFARVRQAAEAELERRRRRFRHGGAPLEVRGRNCVVVDDGIATGATVTAALRVLRDAEVGRIVLAVPVAAPDSLAAVAADADEVVCPLQPQLFGAVGMFYEDFDQVTDDEVAEILRTRPRGAGGGHRPRSTPAATRQR
jgi:putative phosphoribosyl transferase